MTIPEAERDPDLAEKLKAEWPGILAWAIEGCLEWHAKGLAPPEAVRAATAAYLEAEDALMAWVEECCEREPSAFEPASDLFGSWKQWAERAGEYPDTLRRFGDKLETRGFMRDRRKGARLHRAQTEAAKLRQCLLEPLR